MGREETFWQVFNLGAFVMNKQITTKRTQGFLQKYVEAGDIFVALLKLCNRFHQ